MMTLTQRIQPHPQVVDTELEEGETILLHLESKTYYSLNATGTHIWQGLKAGIPLQDISHRLQTTFAVDGARADRSVLTLVQELFQHQLVQTLD
jgi:hypothetical protein